MISTLIAGPGEEPVSLADAKAWCRIDGDDEDGVVTATIAAARAHLEAMTGRALVTQDWRLTVNCPTSLLLSLPVAPVRTVTAATGDGDAIGVTLQGDAVLLPATAYETVSIDYSAGYGAAADVPADLKQALLILVAYWFENRDAVMATVPAGFERLIAGYRRVGL